MPESPAQQAAPCIGILDSGVGGLSVLSEIRELLPGLPLHYVGDSAWCPYGNKTAEAIQERVMALSEYLIQQGAGMLVLACNSATIHAVELLRNTFPLPIVGMEPGVKPAAKLTKTGVVGILATEASIAGEKFHRLVDLHARDVRVITKPCPRFVELVEKGMLDGPEVEEAVKEALLPLIEEGADVLVLGCTHYPFLRQPIEECLPPGITVLDTGKAVARRVQDLLPAALSNGSGEEVSFLKVETSGDVGHWERIVPLLLPAIPVPVERFSG